MTTDQIIKIVVPVLGLTGNSSGFTRSTKILGNFPEFDSQAAVSILLALEDTFEIQIADDEVSAELFETVGSIEDFVAEKIREQ